MLECMYIQILPGYRARATNDFHNSVFIIIVSSLIQPNLSNI